MTDPVDISPKIENARDIIGLWPSIKDFAADIGVPYVTGQMMKLRNNIAPDHWQNVVKAARRRRFTGVNLTLLMRLRRERVPQPRRRPNGTAKATDVAAKTPAPPATDNIPQRVSDGGEEASGQMSVRTPSELGS